ncbi:MAG: PEP-CTERM sorting domain-containing protein [Planctomycetota bacterium]|jgi:hypothetical protein
MRKQTSIVITLILFIFFTGVNVSMAVLINDGGIHTIDYEINDWLEIKDSPAGQSTSVNFEVGALVREHFSLWDSSIVNMYNGILEAGAISYADSKFNIYNGIIKTGGYYFGTGHGRSPYSILTDGNVWIYDCLIYSDIVVRLDGSVNIYGGTLYGDIDINTGGNVVLHGRNFILDGNPIDYRDFGDGTHGHLEGELLDGNAIDSFFWIGEGHLELIPEPATLLLLGFGAVMLRRKR